MVVLRFQCDTYLGVHETRGSPVQDHQPTAPQGWVRGPSTPSGHKKTKIVLGTLFDRLYVLHNQLVHGGATWGSKTNRQQVKDGARLFALLVPIYIDLTIENLGEDWGKPNCPVVDG
jgi:hypothetical protein